MFTKIDYEDYFNTLKRVEQQMIVCIDRILEDVTDSAIVNSLQLVRNDELHHLKMEYELFDILAEQKVNFQEEE